jgi:broad specificity phosphatase PhoE
MILYIIRHGQTAWNKEEVFRGTKDIPLNDVGKKEAQALGAYLKDVSFDAIYTSPLSRAVQTAEAVARPVGITPRVEAALIDLNFGSWQGVSHDEVKMKFPDLYRLWKNAPDQVKFPEGESLNDVSSRVDALLKKLLKDHTDQVVGLFSHRVVCKVLLCRLLGLDLSRFWNIQQSTACLNRFRFHERGWICELINSQCHLEALQSLRTTADF